MMEIYGEGVLLLGESGMGKSEAAIELVKRGHRLVADDAVEIRKTSESTLMATAPEVVRNFVELRGIGIINVAQLFGRRCRPAGGGHRSGGEHRSLEPERKL